MTQTTTAVYENGILRPMQPLTLKDGEIVQVTVSTSQPSDDEIVAMMRAARTPEELFAIANAYPATPGAYDLCEALNNNRGPGERVLFPPELKGKTW